MILRTFLKKHKHSVFKVNMKNDEIVYYSGAILLKELAVERSSFEQLGSLSPDDLSSVVLVLDNTYELLIVEKGYACITCVYLQSDGVDAIKQLTRAQL